MENSNSTIALPESGITAYLSESLTFGQQNELDDIMNGNRIVDFTNPDAMQALKISELPYPTLKKFLAKVVMFMVKKLIDKNGTEIQVTTENLNNLSMADGQFLQTECITRFAQKKTA